MSCPFKSLYANKPQSNSAEDTITGWGCQVIKDGGLNFYIKTDKFLECEYHEGDEEETASACPFRFHSSTNAKKIDMNEVKKEIQQNKEKQEQKKKEFEEMKQKMNEIDDEGHFTIPLLNMPPFLTFKETKEILSSMEMKLKDNNLKWDQLHFYIKKNTQDNNSNNNNSNNNNNNNFTLINENKQLNEIIKNGIDLIYLI
ncbi:hypothetical protein DICPUDRAFT_76426 [Dictyostelium purpureum]|uniref:Uncharacterized protein n=1 Tax=Dictyostelium purpureum TaxID=5786 RepID=F0ZDK5_DICPU|nr:uncharacterized protein DICPUDRAFT_76426 [Dictyostelium purpureum]EGC37996.1 hypothetical protein DICPUDRAFT_76426 [Dictyostelium purpureum]|eukprot:XP_003285480.1 hypothetical protein DICPUDRAFT_76426 [Dictyostelium purpureum]